MKQNQRDRERKKARRSMRKSLFFMTAFLFLFGIYFVPSLFAQAKEIKDENQYIYKVLSVSEDGTHGTVALKNWWYGSGVMEVPSVVESNGVSYKVIQIGYDHTVYSGKIGSENDKGWNEKNNSEVEKFIIPDTVKWIHSSVFHNEMNLKEVHIPASVRKIGSGAFAGCKGIEIFTVAQGNLYYKYQDGFLMTKDGKMIISAICTSSKTKISKGVNRIASYAFADNTSIEKIQFGDSLKTIDPYAFAGCEKLQTVKLPNKLEKLGEGAFYNCGKLKRVSFGKKLKKIERETFGNCISIKEITIPGNIKTIGEAAFRDCEALRSIQLKKGVRVLEKEAFCGTINAVKLSLPRTLRRMEGKALSECNAKITIPKGVKYIGSGTFYRCYKVTLEKGNSNYISKGGMILTKNKKILKHYSTSKTKIVLPNGLRKVEYGSITGGKLKYLVVPKSVTELQLAGLKEVKSITCFQKKAPIIKTELGKSKSDRNFTLNNKKKIKIIIPKGSKKSYQKAVQKKFSSFQFQYIKNRLS